MSSVYEVVAETPFLILLRNFYSQKWRLPKNTVVARAARSTIANISLSDPGAQEQCGMVDIFPPDPPSPDAFPILRSDLMFRSTPHVANERDDTLHSTFHTIRTREIRTSPVSSPPPHPVLNLTPKPLSQHEPDVPHLPLYVKCGEKDTFVKQTVDKELSADGPITPSAELSDSAKVDYAYVDWQEAIDLSHIRSASL